MSLIKPQTIDAKPPHRDAAEPLRAPKPSAALIAFPGPEARRTRRTAGSGEPRGEILLFLGVRYERLAS